MNNYIRNISLFNSPLEIGIRVTILLDTFSKNLSLQEILNLDYLVIHLKDLDPIKESLHPDIPNRSGEIIIKRDITQKALDLMFSRELIAKHFNSSGIKYSNTVISKPFINAVRTSYIDKIINNSKIVYEHFQHANEQDINTFIKNNLNKWGSEFQNESYLYDYLDL